MTLEASAESTIAKDLQFEPGSPLAEALANAQKQMRRRIDMFSDIAFEADANGSLVFLNQAWMRILGYPPEASLGHRLEEYVVAEDRLPCDLPLADCGPASKRSLIRLRRTDGSLIWTEASIDTLSGGGTIGIIRDVNAQKIAQQEFEKLSLVASYTDNLVVITDRYGLTEWVNPAFVARTGYALEDLVGRKPGDLLQGPDTDPEAVRSLKRHLQRGVSFTAELLNYPKTGDPYFVQMNITPIRDARGEIERFIAIETDTTELHEARAALEAAKKRAESANEAKTQFLATVSHEMRTPLNAIIGSVELALREEADPADLRTNLLRIGGAAESLLRLISDMLDVSKIEAGQIDIEKVPVDIRSSLQDSIAPFIARARAKGLEFGLKIDEDLPSSMLGDPDRLRQIVSNLVENALKFTEHGYVRVTACRLADGGPEGASLEIGVADSGAGIAPDQLRRIFDRYVQVDSSHAHRKVGTGLGLNIVKSLCAALGGSVDVVSRPGAGSEFRVRLPLVAVADPFRQTERNSKAGPSERAAAPAKIMIAEDNNVNFELMEAFLKPTGYLIERAANGREAVEKCEAVDLILMDVEMPEMDGLEATQIIRERERASGRAPLPIIALTAHAVQQFRDRCMAAGCTGYLSKPVRMRPLMQTIATALEEKATARSADALLSPVCRDARRPG